jgi:hypothetical protein
MSEETRYSSFRTGKLAKRLTGKFEKDQAKAFERHLKNYVGHCFLTGEVHDPDLWSINEIDNGGFYLVPPQRQKAHIRFPNNCELEVNTEELGLVITSYVLNHMATFEPHGEADKYFEKLQNHISSMKHAESILAAIH